MPAVATRFEELFVPQLKLVSYSCASPLIKCIQDQWTKVAKLFFAEVWAKFQKCRDSVDSKSKFCPDFSKEQLGHIGPLIRDNKQLVAFAFRIRKSGIRKIRQKISIQHASRIFHAFCTRFSLLFLRSVCSACYYF